MPSWAIHLQAANLLYKRTKNMDKNKFIFGNILPDINNGYVIKEISKTVSHIITHFSVDKDFGNYETFYNKYKENIKNPLVIGYLTHLLTDFYFNDLTYSKKGLYNREGKFIGIKLNSGKDKICTKEEARILKTNDFKIYANYIYENNKIDELKYDNEILLVNDIIEEISIKENDILNTIKYINLHIQGKEKIIKEDTKEYKIFTQNELKEQLDLCVNFIVKYLDSKKWW